MGEYKLGRAFLVVFYGDDSSDMVFPVCANWRRLLRKVRVGGINVRNLDRATSGRMENLEDMGEWNGFFFFSGKIDIHCEYEVSFHPITNTPVPLMDEWRTEKKLCSFM